MWVEGLHDRYSVEETPIAQGGVGAIHRTQDPNLVYKRYFKPTKAPQRKQLDPLVAIGRDVLIGSGHVPGDSPESSVNWPVDLVQDRLGQVTGIILPAIPANLFHDHHGVVRGLEFLIMARSEPPTARARIVLLLRMAEILNYINARGLIHGDINGKNLAWTLSPELVMYLIDCDGMVPQSPSPRHGVAALGWTDPRLVEKRIAAHDQYSDWYALALAMYRGLLLTPGVLSRADNGRWPGPAKIPDEFPPMLKVLIERGLNPLDPFERPRPQEWVDALVAVFLPDGHFDDAAIAEMDAAAHSGPASPAFLPLPATDWDSTSHPPSSQPPSPPRPLPPVSQKPTAPLTTRPASPVPQNPTVPVTTGMALGNKAILGLVAAFIVLPLVLTGIKAMFSGGNDQATSSVSGSTSSQPIAPVDTSVTDDMWLGTWQGQQTENGSTFLNVTNIVSWQPGAEIGSIDFPELGCKFSLLLTFTQGKFGWLTVEQYQDTYDNCLDTSRMTFTLSSDRTQIEYARYDTGETLAMLTKK